MPDPADHEPSQLPNTSGVATITGIRQRFRSAAPPFYDVEYRYQNPGDDNKYDFVIAHLEDARHGDPHDLYITFASAVDLTARGYAKTINPRLNDYLASSPPGRLGIIGMDYCEQPPDLISNVIKTNTATAATGGRDDGHRSHDRRTGGDPSSAPTA